MRTRKKTQSLTEPEIDQIVVVQAEDDAAWGKPVQVRIPERKRLACWRSGQDARVPRKTPQPWGRGDGR
jgi:hypothetical protein